MTFEMEGVGSKNQKTEDLSLAKAIHLKLKKIQIFMEYFLSVKLIDPLQALGYGRHGPLGSFSGAKARSAPL